jgi:hypothetical protein
MYETLQTIQNLAQERFELYLLAGHQHLTPEQQQRIETLTVRLGMAWDEHRSEVAAKHWGARKVIALKPQPLKEAA